MEKNIASTIPTDYNIGNFAVKTALPLFDILSDSMSLNYPADNDSLKSICEKAIIYMDENNLVKASIYNQIKFKIQNFDILKDDSKEYPGMKEDNFNQIKKIVAIHSAWISIKLGIDLK